jgi:hypothetical protein
MDTPELQPPPISDEEVEQLLRQAESLVDDIVDVSLPADIASPVPAAGFAVNEQPTLAPQDIPVEPPAPDALLAITQTQALVEEVSALVSEVEAATVLDEASLSNATSTASVVDSSESIPAAFESTPPITFCETALDGAPDPQPCAISSDSFRPESLESELQPALATAADASNNPPGQVTNPPAWRRLFSRLSSIGRRALDLVLAVLVVIVNFPLRLLVLLDRPFARCSSETKLRIGLCAVVTLFMGAAAWILPRVAARNPYASIGP